MEKSNANCMVVNAGGIMDFFPESWEFTRKNPFLENGSELRELIEECHRHRIHVIARVDFRGVERERYEVHPEWFGMDSQGNGQIGWKSLYRSCYNSLGKYQIQSR